MGSRGPKASSFSEDTSAYTDTLNKPRHEKTCFMPYANKKGTDQPAHPRSLIIIFVVRCLDSIILPLSIFENSSLYLASDWFESTLIANTVAHLRFCCEHVFSMFCCVPFHMSHVTRKPVFGVCDQVRLKPACSADETS